MSNQPVPDLFPIKTKESSAEGASGAVHRTSFPIKVRFWHDRQIRRSVIQCQLVSSAHKRLWRGQFVLKTHYTLSFLVSHTLRHLTRLTHQLMEILDDESTSHIITWLPSGNGFIVRRKEELASEVLHKYFKETKYASFTRRLNRWGFIRIRTIKEHA